MYNLGKQNLQSFLRWHGLVAGGLMFLLVGCAGLDREKNDQGSPMGLLGELQSSLTNTKDQAQHGQAEGQLSMGKIYWNARYYSDALSWFQQAAQQGNAEAKYRMGYAYYTGLGTQRNIDSARQWYQQAAEAGSLQAQNALALLNRTQGISGVVYASTEVLADKEQARSRMVEASQLEDQQQSASRATKATIADQVINEAAAIQPVQRSEKHNSTSEADSSKKKSAVRTAAAVDSVTSKQHLTVEKGSEKNDASAERIASAEKKAPTEAKTSIAAQIVNAIQELSKTAQQATANNKTEPESEIQSTKHTQPTSQEKGIAALQQQAEQGDHDAQLQLSIYYFEGKQVAKDLVLAAKWGEMAAEGGNSIAQNNMGAAYTHGNGVNTDLQQAFSWYKKSAEQGYVLAQYNLAAAYAMGAGVERDYVKALAWFTLVMQAEDKQAPEMRNKLQQTITKLKEILTKQGKLSEAFSLAKQYAAQYVAH